MHLRIVLPINDHPSCSLLPGSLLDDLLEVGYELLLGNSVVVVAIQQVEHIFNLLVVHTSQQFTDLVLLQLPRLVLVEEVEGLSQGLQLEQLPLVAHGRDELVEVHLAGVVLVDRKDHLLHLIHVVMLRVFAVELLELLNLDDAAVVPVDGLKDGGEVLAF